MAEGSDSAATGSRFSNGEYLEQEVSGFRSIFKNVTVLGGVQVFSVLIALIRGKLLAVLIGTAGMGLNGLLLSGLNLINRFSGLGLSESAVRDIAAANASGDERRISRVYTVFNRWIWLSAFLGVVLTIIFAPLLSRFAFSDGSKSVLFMVLSSTFIFGALTGGIYALLRGMQKIKDLAWANIIGALTGLVLTLPIYYFYRMDGVVPAIIVASAVTFAVSVIFKRKASVKTTNISLSETYLEGKQMVALGITLSLGGLMSEGVRFLLSAYVSRAGSLSELGIFNAGQSIMDGYVGMVFLAMGTDYYPRLCAAIDKPESWMRVVNQQIEIVLLILGPILAAIVLTAPLLIKLLLSSDFLPAVGYIYVASLAVLFKGVSWASGFIIIAKGSKRLFLYVQFAGAVVLLFVSVALYRYYGINGLGIALLVSNIFAVILLYFVIRKQYGFVLSFRAYRLLIIFLLLLGLSLAFVWIAGFPAAYYYCAATLLVTLIISVRGLNKRMDIRSLVRRYIKR